MTKRCSYCRRTPSFVPDEHGLVDERVMRFRADSEDDYGRRRRYTEMSESEFNRVAGQVAMANAR